MLPLYLLGIVYGRHVWIKRQGLEQVGDCFLLAG
jgi:hypothetical protein